MKQFNFLFKNITAMVLLLICLDQGLFALGPYHKLCWGFSQSQCIYSKVPEKIGLCNGDTYELIAYYSDFFLPCSGTRQWYTFVYGWICVGTFCHQGWYPQTIEGATGNEYTVTDKGKYWCVINCGSGPYNTDTVEVAYDSNIPVIYDNPDDQTICDGMTATFNASGTANYVQYQWAKEVPQGSYTSISGANSNLYSYIPPLSDNQSKLRCYISNGCGGQYSDEANLTVNPLPVIEIGNATHICDGSELVLDAGPDFSAYSWSTGAITRTITVNSEALYSVTVTDNHTCSNSDNIYIYVDPAIPSLDLGSDKYTCPGEEVNLNAASGYDNYLWSTGANTQSLVVTGEGAYSVQVSKNANVCVVTDTINVVFSRPYEDEEIGLVTIDLESGDNLVIWERTLNKGTDYYEIYRGSAGNETYLGRVDFKGLTVFRDVGTFDDGMSYRYEILVVDTCGNKSQYSSSHKTMHLTASKGVANEVNLAWNHYEGFPVTLYYIYRGTDSANLQLYDSIQYDLTTTAKTDYNPPAGIAYYRIGVKAPKVYIISSLNKADSGPYSHSMSNIEDNRFQTGLNKLNSSGNLSIYPNPSADQTTVSFPNPEQKKYQLVVRDLSGKMVLAINNIIQDNVTIKGGRLKSGYYSIEVIGDKIYHGKLIIE
jgi:hypothetical protein